MSHKTDASITRRESKIEASGVYFRAMATGLTEQQAKQKLSESGYNELPEEKASPILKFLSYFWGPIAWMIEVAVILSAIVKHWADFIIISILLFANAIIGFWEEYQAGNTIEALKKRLALNAKVMRDGKWKVIPAREIVVGDLVRLRIGDIIPADCKLVHEDPLSIDQSALTGESLPVTHRGGDLVYSGSVVKQGENDAIVSATGKNTYFGKTAKLTQQARRVSHFQRAVLKIGDYLIVIALALVALILLVALFRGDNMLMTLEFTLVLTVAAIPVALPTVLSVTMAVGARLLAKKEAVVSRMASIEEMAGIDILCSDKTGTLTQNKLTLGAPYACPGVQSDDVILAASLASKREDQDPIDLAVLDGQKHEEQLSDYKITHFMPFDPVQKRTEADVQDKNGKTFKTSKGAFQVIERLCGSKSEAAQKAVGEFARRGFRSLGVARTGDDGKWKFLGVLPLFDPPREDSKSTIATAGTLGIDVKMVTGDQIAIATEMAKQLGLGTNILDATVLAEGKQHETAKNAEAIEHSDGFAQVFPEHKYHIIDVLQKMGHFVGMTGDGVNDAPALKKADAGIAVAGATDAARSAADLVLLTPGLSVIIDAIKESRRIFQRMQSYATYRIAETIRVLLFMTLSILVFNFYPVTAVMIVLLALFNDGAILSIAYDNALCSEKPERWNMKGVLGIATILGILGVIASFSLFYLAERIFHLPENMIRSLIYLKLSVAGQLTIFITRTRGPFWSFKPSRLLVGAVVLAQSVATLVAVYGIFMTPIGWRWAGFVWAYAFFWFLVNDRVKLGAYRIFDSKRTALGKTEA